MLSCRKNPRKLQLARAAEGSESERDEEESDGNRERDEPASGVAAPSAYRRIEPRQGEHGEGGADELMKKLLQNSP